MASSRSAKTLASVTISHADVMRLTREIDQLDEYYHQLSLQQRVNSAGSATLPHASVGLSDFSDYAGLNIDTAEGRQGLRHAINDLLESSPRFNISFASEPPLDQLQKIVEWLRANIHASALVQTSVQPAIIAGCIIRSSSKVFDLSLRNSFEAALPKLTKEVRAL